MSVCVTIKVVEEGLWQKMLRGASICDKTTLMRHLFVVERGIK